MNRTTIVRIAEWTGWCGPCAAERPLVLTRTGRYTLRTWLTGAGEADRPLTLTCRLCGVGVVVPPEADDPEVVLDDEPELVRTAAADVGGPAAAEPLPGTDAPASGPPVASVPLPEAVPALVPSPAAAAVGLPALAPPLPVAGPDLHAGRQAVADALSQLLHQRTAEAPAPLAQQLPQQRSPEESAVDGVQALQLLAEGLDLLSVSQR